MTITSCPFCTIAHTYPPFPPTTFLRLQNSINTNNNDTSDLNIVPPTVVDSTNYDLPVVGSGTILGEGQAHLILSTHHVLAFLDIMPLTRGHVLVVPRRHCEKLADVGVGVGREIGQWLPIISRVVMRVLFGDAEEEKRDWCWNVVQNNGVRAAQQVPHVHFHVIPRPPDRPATTGLGKTHMSYVMFGRGQREDLDDEEGEVLARLLREELAREVQRVKREEGVDLEGEFGVVNGKGKL
ncbi:HIT-like protein [Aspergillus sclerotiicarbonarius CBS 121057]|uniref:HIT-like protein n=1 Tax=Aspergillus sclerotiicarbonarius (strain CBS 121057 / IBT 28362) TaxID=1448318 RepID=A0A319F389_ASPSB|nr:HIT-like protein [Aspergillus sclerotiicarbonarius CBS 121057]